MKKMKKVISAILAVIMTLSAASVAVNAEDTATQCTHTLESGESAFGKWIISQNETCTENGIKYRECALCKHIETGFVKATGHSFGEGVVVAPTCAGKGYTTYTCTNCGEAKNDNEVPALAHTYGEWTETLAPTCIAEGTKQKTCTVCDETAEGHVFTEAIPALGHDYVSTVVAPTYTEDGYTLHKCSRCDANYTDSPVDKLKGRVESVELGDKVAMKYGEVAELKPDIKIGGNVTVTKVFTSAAENVATVDENGNITGKGMGTTTITCTVTDEYGNVVTDTVDVQVSFSLANWFDILRQVLKAAIDIVIGGLDFTPIKELFGGNK